MYDIFHSPLALTLLVAAVALSAAAESASATLPDATAASATVALDVDQATRNLVTATATKGYIDPGAAMVTHIRKSRAINGTGYCGDVTVEGSKEMTVFHVVLTTPRGPSVLRLADYPMPEHDPVAETVHVLMQHFGCTD